MSVNLSKPEQQSTGFCAARRHDGCSGNVTQSEGYGTDCQCGCHL